MKIIVIISNFDNVQQKYRYRIATDKTWSELSIIVSKAKNLSRPPLIYHALRASELVICFQYQTSDHNYNIQETFVYP